MLGGARDAAGRRWYAVDTCTPTGGPVRSAARFQVLPALRQQFQLSIGVPPTAYRRTFRGV